jgi:hypothetical protein
MVNIKVIMDITKLNGDGHIKNLIKDKFSIKLLPLKCSLKGKRNYR